MRVLIVGLCVLAGALLGAGCDDDPALKGRPAAGDDAGDTTDGGTAPKGRHQAEARLHITVDTEEGTHQLVLRCPPAAASAVESSHAEALATACARLAEDPKMLTDKPKPGTACTQQYGGPETGFVRGTLDGKSVSARFDRSDGCRIAQWNRASALWTAALNEASTERTPNEVP